MKPQIRIIIASVVGVVFLAASSVAVAYEFTTLATMQSNSDQTGWSGSMLTSDDSGNLYYAFKNAGNKIEVGKWILATGVKETASITPLWGGSDTHYMLAIAIDLNGYLHVMGPVHNNTLDYLVSNAPFSVTGGFTRQVAVGNSLRGINLGETKDNGDHAHTYPFFVYDNDYNPIFGARMRVGNNGFKPQAQAMQLARYDSTTQLWEDLGGNTNPDYFPVALGGGLPTATFPNSKIPSFIWSTRVNGFNSYTSWGDKPFIDNNGRWHFSHKQFDNLTSGVAAGGFGNNIIYFYSDDGVVWRTANGTAVATKPIIIPGGVDGKPAHDVSMYVRSNATAWVYENTNPAVASDGNPVVAYSSKQGGTSFKTSKWNGLAWVERNHGFTASPPNLHIDTHGVWYVTNATQVKVSIDDGATWKTYSHNLGNNKRSVRVDTRYFKKTGKIRLCARASSGTVSFIEFVSDEWRPPNDSGQAPPMPPAATVQ